MSEETLREVIMRRALETIAAFDYEKHPTQSNEWAEADYFNECQVIARDALARISPAVKPDNGQVSEIADEIRTDEGTWGYMK